MQEKNEIKAGNFDDKLMLKKKEKQYELFQKYFEHDNGITSNLINLKKEKQNFDQTFLANPNLDKIKNTPIFYLCEILKEMNLKELDSLEGFSTLLEKKNEINRLIDNFSNPEKNYEGIKSSIKDDLKKIYEKIESKIIADYIKEHYCKNGEKINSKVDINLEEEIKNAAKLEKEIHLRRFPNELLKEIIKKMSEFIGLIGEKDDEEKIILNEIKKEIDSIMKDSESGEISKKWNFDEPMLKKIDIGYFFNVIHNNIMQLNNYFELEEDKKDKKNSITLKQEDIDNILEQMMDKIHNLALYEKVKDVQKIRKLINKLLYINDNKEKPAEPISKEETEKLMGLLSNYENIDFCSQHIENLRGDKDKLNEYEFNIMGDIFKKIATFAWENRVPDFFQKIIMTSNNYYLEKENKKKFFLYQIIKEDKLFKEIALWEFYLHYKFSVAKKKENLDDDKIQNAVNLSDKNITLLAYTLYGVFQSAYIFGISEESFKKLINKEINKFPERYKEQIQKIVSETFEDWKRKQQI